jgi:hypothetical protein
MSVNDILVQGAEPVLPRLLRLRQARCRYRCRCRRRHRQGLRTGRLRADRRRNRRNAGHVPGGEYDLGRLRVGVVEKSKAIDGKQTSPRATWCSAWLPRRAFQRLLAGAQDHRARQPGHECQVRRRADTLADVVMAPTRIYVKPMLAMLGKGHHQGHGPHHRRRPAENVPRVLPENTVAAPNPSCLTININQAV